MSRFNEILSLSLAKIDQAGTLEELEKIRVEYIGKNGQITSLMKELGALSPEERKDFGAEVNRIKENFSNNLENKREELERIQVAEKLNSETLDLTESSRPYEVGKIHPITRVTEEVISIFGTMGFVVTEGPDIESDWHNFTALNIPANHPARQMHDTFYMNAKDEQQEPLLLRTHTSPVQIRTMLNGKPPFRIISPGRTYRCDSDQTHTPMFHQCEGLLIDKNIHFGHLKSCIIEFIQRFFESDEVPVRFRPNFFPFTEPSAEVDIGCVRENGEIKIGKGDRWLEVMGCGMVHPNVLRNVNIDPEEYQGFAFGLGIERMAMLKYGISDLRTFFDGDLRWLNHYGFSPFDVPNLLAGLTR